MLGQSESEPKQQNPFTYIYRAYRALHTFSCGCEQPTGHSMLQYFTVLLTEHSCLDDSDAYKWYHCAKQHVYHSTCSVGARLSFML